MTDREAELRELASALASLDASAIEEQIVELGLVGIDVPEADGGSGGSLADLLVIVEEFAAQGIISALIDASCGHWVINQCGSDVNLAARTTVKLLDGTAWNGRSTRVITGVPWATHSTRVLIVDTAGTVCSVDTAKTRIEPAQNVAGEPRDTLVVDANSATEIGSIGVNSVWCRLGLLRSAALVGAATGVYRITKQHVAEREQFGAPLVRIPAVATQLAIIKTHVLQMQTALARAKAIYDREGAEAAVVAVAIARVMATSSAGEVARLGHQLHGAIGTTIEHRLHRYTRPLWAWRDDDGLPRQWQQFVGRAALSHGEPAVWHELTAPA
jgi:acyl-CoA dehydrogenase